jgi:protein-disulfide isomerase
VRSRDERGRRFVNNAAIVSIMACAGAFLYFGRQLGPTHDQPLPTELISIQGAAVLGKRTAKVAIIEYSEFECPFCARFARDTEATIRSRYVDSGRVLIAFRHFPLEKIHPLARLASEAAVCADEQGQFIKMHDLLFSHQPTLSAASPSQFASQLGLDPEMFGSCMKGRGRERVRSDMAEAAALGITSTPTFLIGLLVSTDRFRITKIIKGARPTMEFEAALNEIVQRN